MLLNAQLSINSI